MSFIYYFLDLFTNSFPSLNFESSCSTLGRSLWHKKRSPAPHTTDSPQLWVYKTTPVPSWVFRGLHQKTKLCLQFWTYLLYGPFARNRPQIETHGLSDHLCPSNEPLCPNMPPDQSVHLAERPSSNGLGRSSVCLCLTSCHALLRMAEKPVWASLMRPCRHSI